MGMPRLAHHAFRGEVWEKAVTYLRQAGAKALAHSAYRDAVTCFEQALTALYPLPDTREKLERGIDLRLDLRQSLFPLNELATLWRYLQEAERLARTLDDPRRLGWVSAYMSGHHVHTGGHVTDVRTFAERVEAIAERLVVLIEDEQGAQARARSTRRAYTSSNCISSSSA